MLEFYRKFKGLPFDLRLAIFALVGIYLLLLVDSPGFVISITGVVVFILAVARVGHYLQNGE